MKTKTFFLAEKRHCPVCNERVHGRSDNTDYIFNIVLPIIGMSYFQIISALYRYLFGI